MNSSPIIQLAGVCAAYGSRRVLSDVNLTVYERDFLGIIGPNGGGKTTLMKIILGLKSVACGTVTCFRSGKKVPHICMGYLPQYSQIDTKFPISVYEVVRSGMNHEKHLWQSYSAEQCERAREMVKRMGLESLAERPVGALSGGQLQRALLGRAIVSRPEVLILDEPNTYIDKQFEGQLYDMLEEINRHTAIILVSHDVGSVLQNVRSIACVDGTLHYHPETETAMEWIGRHLDCPIELVGHGELPHRVLKNHLPAENHDHSY